MTISVQRLPARFYWPDDKHLSTLRLQGEHEAYDVTRLVNR
jgi:hypothetical protein